MGIWTFAHWGAGHTHCSTLCLNMHLKHAVPFGGMYIFHYNCSYVVEGWNHRCRSQLVSGWSHCCSLWTRIYELADEIGEMHIRVIKVKAHLTLRQDMEQHQKLCVIGNSYADKGAKRGADKHPSSEPLRAFIKNLTISHKSICKFMVASCLKAFELRPKMPEIEKGPSSSTPRTRSRGIPHFSTVWMDGFSAAPAIALLSGS